MLGYAFLLHPVTNLDCLEMAGIETRAQIVIVHPCRCRPQTGTELRLHIEFLVASSLTMMSHLQIVAVHILHVFGVHEFASTLLAKVAKEYE